MFSSASDNPEEAAQELLRRSADLPEALERIGLYVRDRQTTVQDTTHGAQAFLFLNATIGRLAFSQRVQRPEQEAFDAAFEDMTEGMINAEYEERRRALDE